MTDPITFASATPRFALPHLFTAQAQKEFTVNEALARLDVLIHPAIEGEANVPPAAPAEGATWIVGNAPTGDWEGRTGQLASWQSANWIFIGPADGMCVFDRSAGVNLRFDGSWSRAAAVAPPTGGATQDAEARAAIAGLVAALVSAGILASA